MLDAGALLWNEYRVIRPIGAGGMGIIYLVYHPPTNAYRVAKLVNQQTESIIAQFEFEAQLHPTLVHPHIIRCYQGFESPPGLLLDYADGGSLRQVIQDHGQELSVNDILPIVQQIADALDYLHRYGYCHCDVKPDNILCDRAGNFYLTDFGISQQIGAIPETKRGSPKYMAPEQHLEQSIERFADVYSFGITVYELFTGGRVPFTRVDSPNIKLETAEVSVPLDTLAHQHVYVQPPPPSYFRPSLPPVIDAILLKALAKRPTDRFTTVKELAEALESALVQRQVPKTVPTISIPVTQPDELLNGYLVCTTHQDIPNVQLRPTLLIGRDRRECLIALPEKSVSRRHVMIMWDAPQQRFVIWDQGSKLGTRINGRQLQERQTLRDGDVISIASFNFRFEERS